MAKNPDQRPDLATEVVASINEWLAAEAEPCAGLVFYGYPLVAPGSGRVRATDHLDMIPAPMLFSPWHGNNCSAA